ncbi:MAG: glycosyltransferase [Candidatus Micrarchaeia archaeon]|jgi:glycosyltransferase involved in cell wall biosynthesis
MDGRHNLGKGVSIIIPTLNEAALIEKVLLTAIKAAPLAEIIVVDGGSKDGTADIAKKHAKVLHAKGRVGAARNLGARASKNPLLLFLDADTYLNEHYLFKAMQALSDKKIVGAGGKIMPEHLNIIERLFFEIFNLLIAASFAIHKPNLAGTCVMYRKSAFNKVGGFDETRAASEDFDLTERIAKVGSVKFFWTATARTSKRRLSELGLLGLIADWTRTTAKYIVGVKESNYAAFRGKAKK